MKPSTDGSSSAFVSHPAPELAFLDALNAAGLDYVGPIIADGVLHRFKVNGDHNPNSSTRSTWTALLRGISAVSSAASRKTGVRSRATR